MRSLTCSLIKTTKGLGPLSVVMVLLLVGYAYPAFGGTENSCVKCHTEMGGDLAKPIELIKNDVHGTHNFSCNDCHGGDPAAEEPESAMDPAKGFIGKPQGAAVIAMCAKCHSSPEVVKKYNPSLRVDQEELYWTSIHGQQVKNGDPKPATCASCHGSHGIYKVDDTRSKVYPTNVPNTCGHCHANAEYMKQYNIPTNQFEEYTQSVHAENLLKKGDTSSPACNDCHGNHGAVPPGVKSIAYVCSQCHPIQQELFSSSPHGVALEATGSPSCSDCHNKHKIQHPTDDMLGIQAGGICTSCHSEGDPGWLVAKVMKLQIDTLKEKIGEAEELLVRAEDNGMPSVDSRFDLQSAESDLVKSRTLIHAFSLATVEVVLTEGQHKADSAKKSASKFFNELSFRKGGLWATWIFIVIFVLGLYQKIKDLDRERKKMTHPE